MRERVRIVCTVNLLVYTNPVAVVNTVSNVTHLLLLFIGLDKVTKYTWNGVLFPPNTHFCILHNTLALMIILQIQMCCYYVYHTTMMSDSPILFFFVLCFINPFQTLICVIFKNGVPTSQRTLCVSVAQNIQLMLRMEIIAV